MFVLVAALAALGTSTVGAARENSEIAIPHALVATPDMGVTGPGSYGSTFSWFVDRTSAALPQPTVYSVPMWVYRTIMFAWALWIALALARWLRFAWRAWSTGAYWKAAQSVPRDPTIDGTAA